MTDYLPGSIKHLNMLLGEQLTEGEGGGGGETWNTVFEGSVTTTESETAEGTINYSEQISADTIKVTFNGTEYECPKINTPFGGVAYGGIGEQGYDFSEYPFVIMSGEGTEQTIVNTLITQTAGTYTLKIEEPQSGGESDFSTAKVTLTNETMFAPMLAYIDNTNGVVSQMGPSGEYDVVLYKGKAKGTLLAPSASVSVTGNITFDDDAYEFVITGDGTVTISE